MGSRGRSIRLRIYFLVAIPLVAMVGLLAYVAGTSISNAISLDRAPNLVNAVAIPAAKFATYLQAERAAAVVYLFQPTAANLQAYQTAIANTTRNQAAFTAAMTSGATVNSETPDEARAIAAIDGDLNQIGTLRDAVQARAVSPLDALSFYSEGMTAEAKLFLAEANSVSDTSELGQALGLISAVQANEQLSQEDALLAGMLAGNRMTTKDRLTFTELAAARQADTQYADSILSPANQAAYNAALAGSGAMQQDLTGIEQAIAANAGAPVATLPVTQAQWQELASTLLKDEYNGGVAVANAILVADHRISHSAWVKVAVTSGIALAGLLITILFTTLVAHGVIRRLRRLERSALTVAEDQLPDVVARLRRGEDVDVTAEAPPLQVGPGGASQDEIGRVSQAFDLVRQTAIRAAVEEARLRRGLNDVFRSLARRSQSLLHRQLTLLDQMERRATDPEALDDLFRLDHLTTRMRRHAEGLVILSGAPPGRGWSSPVRMIDVMRGAIAEVEDYARVSVATRSQAALAGSAVADVIHLLAELIENATTLSPPYTSVRVSGDTVANGFAIEVEDRGLGMSPERLAELNERLASPPEFNPSDSEQLGLFVVSQLAKRHGIRVTLKASAFGGTAAIVLIPRHLVVTEDAFRAGLPGEPAAIGMPSPPTNGNHSVAELAGSPRILTLREVPEIGAPGPPTAPGVRISGALRRSEETAPDDVPRGAHAAGRRGRANAGTWPAPGAAELPGPARTRGVEPAGGTEPAAGAGQPAFDVFMPRRRAQDAAETLAPAEAGADADSDVSGLPRRVRQASLAPQLRADPPRRRAAAAAAAGPASGPTPTEIRRTISALQRGWQEGRSQRTAGSAPDDSSPEPPADPGRFSGVSQQPAAGPAHAASPPAGPDPSSGAGVNREPAAAEDPGGQADGT
jgi:signal transduction histidine kinase